MPRLPRHEEKIVRVPKKHCFLENPEFPEISVSGPPRFQKTRHINPENVQKKIANLKRFS
jgi:hypothetical protein